MAETGEETPKKEMRIKVTENGPYQVYGGVPLQDQVMVPDEEGLSERWEAGKEYPRQEFYELCRCGKSKDKPFCDGTHKHIFFDGSEHASRDPVTNHAEPITTGPVVDLIDIPAICASARFCDRNGGAWDRTRQSDDPESLRIVTEIVANCPAGRLILRNKQGQDIEPVFEPSIGVTEDPMIGEVGPLWVRGGIPIESVDGFNYEIRNRVTLCRCGRSGNKPFCDGRHAIP